MPHDMLKNIIIKVRVAQSLCMTLSLVQITSTRQHVSLQDLPTELHMDIIERLDGKTQSKMSRVSKMYLKATERILYRNIKIDQRVGRLDRLLYTLLVRPDLANSVNSFELVNRAWVPRPFSPKTGDFRKYRKYMGKAVSKLSKLFPAPYVEQWLLGNHEWNQNDHTLGLIFCLATNLESIDFDTENPSFKWTRQLLETNWQTETWLDPSDLEKMEIHDV